MNLIQYVPVIDPSDPDVSVLVEQLNSGSEISRDTLASLLGKIHYPIDRFTAQKYIELMQLCREFINRNYISCADSVYQVDAIQEQSLEFICNVGDLIGWAEI